MRLQPQTSELAWIFCLAGLYQPRSLPFCQSDAVPSYHLLSLGDTTILPQKKQKVKDIRNKKGGTHMHEVTICVEADWSAV